MNRAICYFWSIKSVKSAKFVMFFTFLIQQCPFFHFLLMCRGRIRPSSWSFWPLKIFGTFFRPFLLLFCRNFYLEPGILEFKNNIFVYFLQNFVVIDFMLSHSKFYRFRILESILLIKIEFNYDKLIIYKAGKQKFHI